MMDKYFQNKINEGCSTCDMYLLVLNQWEGLILSVLWRRGFPPPGEDKVDPTAFHHLRSHFSYLVQQLIASSFVFSYFLRYENCLLVVYSNFDDASCFVWCDKRWTCRPLHFKPFPLVFFLRYKKKNLSCLLSSVCLKTSFSSSLAGSAFAGFVIVLLIPPAASLLSAAVERGRGSCNRSDLVSKVNVYRESSHQGQHSRTTRSNTHIVLNPPIFV